MDIIENLERKLDKLLKEPHNAQLINEVGVLLYQVKDWKNAEMYFRKAYELDPTNKQILYNFASLLYLQFHWQKAIPIYQAYLLLDPNDREATEKLRDSYYHLGEYELAASMFEQQ